MKFTKKVLSTSVEFEVTLDSGDLEPARLKALEKLARGIKIPGFRNGKAPANVVERHVNPNDLASNTLDLAVRRAIPKLFDESKLLPISIPHVDVNKYVPGEMAELVIRADIMPEVTLGKYDKLKAPLEERTVSDEDVDDVLKRIAESYAEPKVVKRAAKKGDEVIVDFIGKKDGVAFKGGSGKDQHIRIGSGQYIPGFEDGLIGHEVGDKFNLDITFPENYGNSDLAGAPVVFEFLVKQVSEVVVPPIDDDLAKKSGAFETLKELKEDIRKNLEAQANHETIEKYKDDLLNELVRCSKTEAPKTLIEEQSDNIKEDFMRNLSARNISLDDYLKENKKKKEDWEKDVVDTATKRVVSSIIIQKLSDELKIEVSDEDLNKQVVEMQHVYKNDAEATEKLQDPQVINSIRNRMRINATMDKLVELNKDHAKKIKRPAFIKDAPKAKNSAKKTSGKKSK